VLEDFFFSIVVFVSVVVAVQDCRRRGFQIVGNAEITGNDIAGAVIELEFLEVEAVSLLSIESPHLQLRRSWREVAEQLIEGAADCQAAAFPFPKVLGHGEFDVS
jgi:hypothetical protein